ncbi:REP-associated tyrosine transposase [Thiohalomonas denitrificans]|uniref:REP element-mobilizing transposase RayT n=1 Tax=Thiohalomonas denitrificans TaxID=415747 RepID=A0A1G5Q6R2_9GAMM|nr:transposase [Thiohalomonas denitrificans]SCZ57308.1 REP element-mobilizing transposase RayT [Thiohalomonas denitrificans]
MESANHQSPHVSALRRGRFSEPGRIYLVTTATNHRRPLFTDFHLSRLAIKELRQSDMRGRCETLAFVLMPNHLHWLLQLRDTDLSRLLRLFKAHSGKVINAACGTPAHRIWQPGFHDHALRKEEDIVKVARYVIANPLRAGLVRRVGDYPHWDAVWL